MSSAYLEYLYRIIEPVRAFFDFRFDEALVKSEEPFFLAFDLVELLADSF